MTSRRNIWATAALAALVITPVQVLAMATEQGAPGVYMPNQPEIKVAPGGPGTAGDGNGLDFGFDTQRAPAQPEIKVAPTMGPWEPDDIV